MTLDEVLEHQKKRTKQLEEISKAHQKQVGDLISELKDKEQIILLQRENHKREIEKQKSLITYLKSEIEDLDKLSQLLKHSNLLDNADEKTYKEVRDIVDTNYVP